MDPFSFCIRSTQLARVVYYSVRRYTMMGSSINHLLHSDWIQNQVATHQVLNWPPTDSWKCFGLLINRRRQFGNPETSHF